MTFSDCLRAFPAILVYALAGCASFQSTGKHVRSVDVSAAPELAMMVERVRQVGDHVYPHILALLEDESTKSPRQFDVRFSVKPDGHPGETTGLTITLQAAWLRNNPADLERLLVHEMTHVAQNYPARKTIPAYWVEGMADYVCARLGYTNQWNVAECTASRPHYRSGYGCAAAFLLYVDDVHGSDVVRQLHRRLRNASYTEQVFELSTGKTLGELWSEFQSQAAYLAEAAAIARLYDEVGYEVGMPPPDDLGVRIQTRLQGAPAGRLTLEALEFVAGLAKQRRLPGSWSGEGAMPERGETLSLGPDPRSLLADSPFEYPVTRTILGNRSASLETHHYEVTKMVAEGRWHLERAWLTAPGGEVIEQFGTE